MIGIYIRVSSVSQVKDGYSLAAQKERLSAFCTAQGWKSYKFYVEEGLSGKNTKRPVYQKLIEHVESKKINTVLVYKLDRIMRSIGELDKMLKIFEKNECGFKSATEPFDTTNPTGKLFMYIVAAFAQWEIDVSSERISMVLEEKVANEGVWIGNVPYPFDKDYSIRKLVPNPERTKKTLFIIEKYESGESTTKIADQLQALESGNKNWSAQAVFRILKNPALCGDTRWLDKVYENTHEGIISRKRFNKLQTMISDRSDNRRRDVKSTYLFRGILLCPSCKRKLHVNRYFRKRADGSVYQGATYRCNDCAKAKKFTNSVGEPRILNALYSYMENLKLDKIKQTQIREEKPDWHKQLLEVERKRSRYQRAWAEELITDDEFKTRMDETKELHEELVIKSNEYKEPTQIDIAQAKKAISTFNQNFKELNKEEKRTFISTFIRSIEFKLIPQAPLRPDKNLKGRELVIIKNIVFY